MYLRPLYLLGSAALIVTIGCSSNDAPAPTGETASSQSQGSPPTAADSESPAGGLVDIDQLAEATTFPFEFSTVDVAGNPINLSELVGKVVIVDIWGTWCPPCRAEIPSFIRLQESYG